MPRASFKAEEEKEVEVLRLRGGGENDENKLGADPDWELCVHCNEPKMAWEDTECKGGNTHREKTEEESREPKKTAEVEGAEPEKTAEEEKAEKEKAEESMLQRCITRRVFTARCTPMEVPNTKMMNLQVYCLQ